MESARGGWLGRLGRGLDAVLGWRSRPGARRRRPTAGTGTRLPGLALEEGWSVVARAEPRGVHLN